MTTIITGIMKTNPISAAIVGIGSLIGMASIIGAAAHLKSVNANTDETDIRQQPVTQDQDPCPNSDIVDTPTSTEQIHYSTDDTKSPVTTIVDNGCVTHKIEDTITMTFTTVEAIDNLIFGGNQSHSILKDVFVTEGCIDELVFGDYMEDIQVPEIIYLPDGERTIEGIRQWDRFLRLCFSAACGLQGGTYQSVTFVIMFGKISAYSDEDIEIEEFA